MIKIRKFKKGDERKLSYLNRKCIITINSKDISKKETEVLHDYFTPSQILRDSHRQKIFVAEYNGKIAGTATMDGDWIRAVFVNPTYHGKGIGTKLIKYIENLIKRNGFRSVSLNSSPSAENFYKKLGYKKVKEIHKEVGRMILMKKKF